MGTVVSYLTKTVFLGNEAWRFGLLLMGILGGFVAGRLLRYLIEHAGERLQRAEERRLAGLMLHCLARPAAFLCFVIGLQSGFSAIRIAEPEILVHVAKVFHVLYAVGLGYAIYRMVDVIDFYLKRWAARTESKIDDMLVPLIRKSLRVAVVIVVALFIVESFHGNVTSLLMSLGVGGLAVALAAQDTIKNFFGSIMIVLDKPFQVGDRIVIGGHDGPVEEVGFRSTKIRTLEGDLVTVPNSIVTNEIVRNVGKRPHIRRLTNITITYDTPPEKVKRAVEIIREILHNHEGMHPDFPPRVYFNEFNEASLNIVMIYWYRPASYWDFLEFSNRVNMQILERFNAEGIEFAFPTQTVYLANDQKRQLALRLLNDRTQIG